MGQEIVRNVPLRSSLLPRKEEKVARAPGRLRRIMAAAAVEAAPELIQPRAQEPAHIDVAPAEPAPDKPFSGNVWVGSLGDLFNAVTQLVTNSQHTMQTRVIAEVTEGTITKIVALIEEPTATPAAPEAEVAVVEQDGEPQE